MAVPLEQVTVTFRLVEMLNSVEAGSVGAEVHTTALKIQLMYPVSLKALNDHLQSTVVICDV